MSRTEFQPVEESAFEDRKKTKNGQKKAERIKVRKGRKNLCMKKKRRTRRRNTPKFAILTRLLLLPLSFGLFPLLFLPLLFLLLFLLLLLLLVFLHRLLLTEGLFKQH